MKEIILPSFTFSVLLETDLSIVFGYIIGIVGRMFADIFFSDFNEFKLD